MSVESLLRIRSDKSVNGTSVSFDKTSVAARRRGIGTRIVAIAVVVIVVLGVLGLVLLAPSPGGSESASNSASLVKSESATSSTSVGAQQLNYESTDASGLQIQVKLNATTMPQGGALAAQISLFNTLDQNLSLSAAPNPTFQYWNNYDFYCEGYASDFGRLFGYAVFSGLYNAENVSGAPSPLALAPIAEVPCAYDIRANGVVFLPDGDRGVLLGQGLYVGVQQVAMNATTEYSCNSAPCGEAIFGYWNNTSALNSDSEATYFSPYFVPLQPGQYTLAVQDAWGGAVYAHFQVVASPVGCPAHTICGSFTYSPIGQVKVDSVRATQYTLARAAAR